MVAGLRYPATDEFRRLADAATALFASRRQTITAFREQEDAARFEVTSEGVRAADFN